MRDAQKGRGRGVFDGFKGLLYTKVCAMHINSQSVNRLRDQMPLCTTFLAFSSSLEGFRTAHEIDY